MAVKTECVCVCEFNAVPTGVGLSLVHRSNLGQMPLPATTNVSYGNQQELNRGLLATRLPP